MFPSRLVSVLGKGALPNNYSLDFDGSNDYVAIGDDNAFSFGDGDDDSAFSISAWIKMDVAANFRIASKGLDGTSGEWQFYLNSSGYLGVLLIDEDQSGVYEYTNSDSTLTTGIWYHVACTYNGVGGTSANTGIKLYVNGVEQGYSRGGNGAYDSMVNGSADVWIGRQESTYSNGKIDEVAIWNTALSAGDVAALYSARGTADLNDDGNSSNLVGWWRFEEGSGTSVTDSSTNSNTGTLTNGPAYSTDVPS